MKALKSLTLVAFLALYVPASAQDGSEAQIRYWLAMNSAATTTLTTYDEMSAYQVLQEQTGVDVVFEHPAVGAELEKFNIMIASGNYPEVIEWNWLQYPGGPERALREGIIIPLNDLIEAHAPNLQRILDENPDARRQVSTDDGTIYAFPFLRLDPEVRIFYGLQLRQDWLERLGLEMPATIDDWHQVLAAFKSGDPNGNGQADEIPFSAEDLDGTYPFLSGFGMSPDFYQVDGEVRFAPFEPGYRDFLATLRQWYEEGLIDPAFPSVDDDELEANMANDLIGATAAYVGGGLGAFTTLAEGNVPGFNLVGAPFPEDETGNSYNTWFETNKIFNGYGAAISGQAENVEEIVRFLDHGYSEAGSLALNFGEEGVSYTLVNGEPRYTDEVLNHPELSLSEAVARHARPQVLPSVQDPRYQTQYLSLPVQQAAIDTWKQASEELLLPPIAPSAEDVSTFNSIMADASTYVEEMTVNFILGRNSLDEFEDYRATLQGIGVEEAVAIMQSALDSYNARE